MGRVGAIIKKLLINTVLSSSLINPVVSKATRFYCPSLDFVQNATYSLKVLHNTTLKL
jgi:hypothetical protein